VGGPGGPQCAQSARAVDRHPLGGGTGFLAEDVAAERASQDLRGCGSGLVGPLLRRCSTAASNRSCKDAEDLLVEDGRVSGVELAGGQGVRAQCGVILATGGFEWAPDPSTSVLRGPMTSPASLPHNSGDGLLC
jgi:hypothetical protein